MNVSLDQYIQENKDQDQVSLLIRPKKKLSTEEESELRASLDHDLDNQIRKKRCGGSSKFEGTDDRSDEEEDVEYDVAPTLSIISEDVVMQDLDSSKQNYQEIESMSDDKTLRMLKRPFRTLESKTGAFGESQNWRLERKNALGKRPLNMPYLKKISMHNNSLNKKVRVNNDNMFKNPKTRQNGSIFLTYKDENSDKVIKIETRSKRLRLEAPEAPNCNMPLPVSASTGPISAQKESSLQIENNLSNLMHLSDEFKSFLLSRAHAEMHPPVVQQQAAPVVQQQAAPDPVPLYNSNCGFPVQEQRNEQNDYMEFLNNKHKVSTTNNNNNFGLPSCVIPRYLN